MIYVIFAAAIAAADQLFKNWVSSVLEPGARLEMIPGIVHLTYAENRGAAFSILQNARWLFIIVVFAFTILVLWMILGKKITDRRGLLAISGVLGGALGNGIDRLLRGYVVDMFEVEFMRFAIFNIADIFITLGGIAFCIFLLIGGESFFSPEGRQEKTISQTGSTGTEGTDNENSGG